MGFYRQEYWSGLPFPSPGDLPNPGTEPRSPALQADSLPSEPPGDDRGERKCYLPACMGATLSSMYVNVSLNMLDLFCLALLTLSSSFPAICPRRLIWTVPQWIFLCSDCRCIGVMRNMGQKSEGNKRVN